MSNRSKPFADPLPLLAVDDPRKVVKVVASDGKTGEQKDLSYTNCKVIGNGSFGIVFQARLLDEPGNQDIAIKKVLQDKRFKVCLCSIAKDRMLHAHSVGQNRELQIMRLVSHPNVVDLKAFFYSNGDKVSRNPRGNGPHRVHVMRQRKMRCTSTLCSNMCLKPCIAQVATTQSSSSPCQCYKLSCTCTSCCGRSCTFTLSASAIVTSSHRTCF